MIELHEGKIEVRVSVVRDGFEYANVMQIDLFCYNQYVEHVKQQILVDTVDRLAKSVRLSMQTDGVYGASDSEHKGRGDRSAASTEGAHPPPR